MQDRGYLLNVAGPDDTEELVRQKLDRERLKKLDAVRAAEKRRACAGAGLLIQWALQKAQEEMPQDEEQELASAGTSSAHMLQELSFSQVLSGLPEPIPVSYIYGAKGKPYFKEVPLFFNLSHSGDYVVCVVSEHEIGVDIQWRKPVNTERISNRFFHERERAFLTGFSDKEERAEWFYRLWCRKEAYGKMTGEGIVDAASKDFSTLDAGWMQGIVWEEYSFPKGYQIACCRTNCSAKIRHFSSLFEPPTERRRNGD